MLRLIRLLVIIPVLPLLLLTGCGNQAEVNVEFNNLPYEKLSDYNLFAGKLSNLSPNKRVLPYDLNSPLFSDYAHKARFVWMPEGKSAGYTESGPLDFPEGTILVKNFYYPADFRKPEGERELVETRLLINTGERWEAMTYVWNEEQTEAYHEIAGEKVDVSWVHYDGEQRQLAFSVPNNNQCKGCHDYNGKILPIGPKAANLNKIFPYPEGAENQLAKWARFGYLDEMPEQAVVPVMAAYEDPESGTLENRARAWLDANCAHCHNPGGPANTSGLYLEYTQTNSTALGFCKSPVAAGNGSGGHRYAIVPGHPEKSILTYRIKSNDPGIMMPELGRRIVHEEGAALVEQWIASLEGDCK